MGAWASVAGENLRKVQVNAAADFFFPTDKGRRGRRMEQVVITKTKRKTAPWSGETTRADFGESLGTVYRAKSNIMATVMRFDGGENNEMAATAGLA